MNAARVLRGVAVALIAACIAWPAAATQIVIVNNDAAGEGFRDNTGAAPVGGNTGTTRGQQRLRVFEAAAAQWGALLDSDVQIRIDATFDPLECTGSGAVLGSAGPVDIAADFLGAPRTNTWYPIALANAIRDSDIVPERNDIRATFNVSIDTGTCLAGTTWWYGIDPSVPVPAGRIALLPVVFHEIAHGLGFLTITNEDTGAFFQGTPDVWSHNMLDRTQNRLWRNMTNAQRAQSAVNDPQLVWNGATVTAQIGDFLRSPPSLIVTAPAAIAGERVAAPAEFGPSPPAGGTSGAVVQARDTSNPFVDACGPLANSAQLAGKVALIQRGGCDFTVKVKNVQNAGAIAAVIYNNTTGLPVVGGADATIVIPTYGISSADGAAIASRGDNAVQVTLGFDTDAPPAGTSGGFVRLYAPNPTEAGSSLSHFSVDAFPNLLMEPALNQSLFDRVDLTLALFQDLGWPVEQNAAPTISAPSQLAGTEDTARAVNGIAFADSDAGTAVVQATFAVPSGALSATSTAAVTVSGTPAALQLRGSVAAINAFVAANAVTYAPVAHANGTIVLTVTIDDLGNSGAGGPRTATRNVNLVIAAVNDAPAITAPASIATTEDTAVAVNGIAFADVDAATGTLVATFTVAGGTLTGVASGGVTVTGSGTTTVTLTGTLAALNAYLQSPTSRVSYAPAANASGNFALTLSLNDNGNTGTGGARIGTAASTLQVTAVNDAPTVTSPALYTVGEDGTTALRDIVVADVDAGGAPVTLTLDIDAGRLLSIAQPGDNVTVTGHDSTLLALRGTLVALNAYVANGRVRYSQVGAVATPQPLVLRIDDEGNTGGTAQQATRNAQIALAMNDAPTIQVPPTLGVRDGGTTAIRAIVVGDVDIGTSALSLQLSVPQGTLAASGAGVTVTGGGTSITLTGTVAAINALFAGGGFTFTPDAGQVRPVTLGLVANDGGATGIGGPRTGTASTQLALEILFDDGFE